MRVAIRVSVLALVIAALVGVPAGAAHGWRTPPSSWLAVRAFAGRAPQGGTLLVAASVRLPRGAERMGLTPSASAVVHFASGDVAVTLSGRTRTDRGHRHGHAGWWSPVRVWRGVARVPVRSDEQVGRVAVDVTITLGDGSVTLATFGRIRPARGGETPPPPTDPEPPCTDGCQET